MLKLADLYSPKTAKPRIVDPTTAPATPKIKNVKRTRSAKASLDLRSFSFGCFVGCRDEPCLVAGGYNGFNGYASLEPLSPYGLSEEREGGKFKFQKA
ncbi:hypothetical protein H0H92_008443 [Tricholoma furcatifolium]|nr:hypothetical protein H0H92_008443 [Tricholoma furcatifolium]